MAALVVSISPANGRAATEAQIGIFPGGAIPAIYPAGTAFRIGYGFTLDAGDSETAKRGLGDDTRFELEVDGSRVPMRTDLQLEDAVPVRKTDIADFPSGLPAGWHDFAGRWYDAGKLVLSSRTTIEFVER